MKKYNILSISFLFVMGLFLGTGCMSNIGNHLSSPQIAKISTNDTVALVADFNDGLSYCTGVFVSEELIMTAYHCVEGFRRNSKLHFMMTQMQKMGIPSSVIYMALTIGADDDSSLSQIIKRLDEMYGQVELIDLQMEYTVKSEVGNVGVAPYKTYGAQPYVLYKQKDLALLKITGDKPVHSFAHLANKLPEIGEKIILLGNGEHKWFSFKQTVVSAYWENMYNDGMKDVDGPFMQVQNGLMHGDSGGGAFNDLGELVGINSFIDTESGYGYCIGLSTLKDIMKDAMLFGE